MYGNIRVFKEEKAIVGTHIKRIEKFDEMTNHFLSTYVAHCIRKKGVLKPRELAIDHNTANQISEMSNNPGGLSNNQMHQQSHSSSMIVDQTAASSSTSASAAAAADPANSRMQQRLDGPEELRQAILQLMRELSRTKKMVHKDEVYSVLASRTDKERFEAEMNRLQDDGDICQSFDANHFCLVD